MKGPCAPSEIKLHKGSKTLELVFGPNSFRLTYEFLRVHSPSAEVRGHGNQGGKLPLEKSKVQVTQIEPQGNYAIRISFDDGHDSGIYSWRYLNELCEQQETLWEQYQKKAQIELESLQTSAIKWIPE